MIWVRLYFKKHSEGEKTLNTIPMKKHIYTKCSKANPPVYIMLGVRHSVLFNYAFWRQVGNGAAEAISADVVGPWQAIPTG